jgi:3-(3-hydroxy-phenyl)propionate hydroxylase
MRLDDLVRGHFYIVSTEKTFAAEAVRLLDTDQTHANGQVVCLDDCEGAPENVLACTEEGGLIRQWMTCYGVAAVIVRPDGFAYGGAYDVGGLAQMLNTLGASLSGNV